MQDRNYSYEEAYEESSQLIAIRNNETLMNNFIGFLKKEFKSEDGKKYVSALEVAPKDSAIRTALANSLLGMIQELVSQREMNKIAGRLHLPLP